MKKIAIVTNYYSPEIGAASKRIKTLAEILLESGYDVEVNCPLPNYPRGKIFDNYKGQILKKEVIDGVKLNRYWCYPSNSKNKLVRLVSMLSFAFTLWFSFFRLLKNKPDLFIIQSPPLFISQSAIILAKLLRVKILLNVSDLWPLSAYELGVMNKGLFYSLLGKVEKFNYKSSDQIMGQSQEILDHINKFVSKPTFLYRNLPNFEYEININKVGDFNKTKIIYAGLLGYAQGILDICKNVDFEKYNAELHIYGSGMEEKEIRIFSKKKPSIFFKGSVSSSEIKEILPQYDFSLVPLANSIYGAVPSKIFELIKLGIPVIYMGTGEARNIIEENKIGHCILSKDYIALEKLLEKIKINTIDTQKKYKQNCIKLNSKKFNFNIQKKHFIEHLTKLI